MIFDFSDALILGTIKLAQDKGEGAALSDIIKYADYINHAIPTYSEVKMGIKKFRALDSSVRTKGNFGRQKILNSGGQKSMEQKSVLDY